jgi:hypothetical protein
MSLIYNKYQLTCDYALLFKTEVFGEKKKYQKLPFPLKTS